MSGQVIKMEPKIELNELPLQVAGAHESATDDVKPLLGGPLKDRPEASVGTTVEAGNAAAESLNARSTEIFHKKCKDVILEIEKKLREEGGVWVPLLHDTWKRKKTSMYMINLRGMQYLNFEKINQRLDKLDYKDVTDFKSYVQSMLDGVVAQYRFSSMIKSEVDKVRGVFFENMKIYFPEMNFPEAEDLPSSQGLSSGLNPGTGERSNEEPARNTPVRRSQRVSRRRQ